MRLIDADELKTKAFGKRGGLIHTSDLDNAPTVAEINVCRNCKWARLAHGFIEHGRWEVIDETEPRRYCCSKCNIMSWDAGYNYCPNCGALMSMDEVEE